MMNHDDLHEDILGLKSDLKITNNNLEQTNSNMERIANGLDQLLKDLVLRVTALEAFIQRMQGILHLIKFIGPVAVAGIIVILAKQFGA